MNSLIERIKSVAGQDFDSYGCRVRNPHITARQSIEIADYIVELEKERNELAAQVESLRLAILNAIPFIPGGSVKANLRDAYDETPPAALSVLKTQWQAEFAEEIAVNIGAGATFDEVIMMLDSAMRQHEQDSFSE